MKRTLILAAASAAALALGGCSVPADSAAPTVTITEAPVPEYSPDTEDSPDYISMQLAWNKTSKSNRSDLCDYFMADPRGSFDSFNKGGDVDRETFVAFFINSCS